MPKVSVILPVFNVAKYLPHCLDSLINQTLQDIEIVCVNDCSTDDSLEILTQYSKKDSRIIAFSMPQNSGPGSARNAGIDRASGDYVMFVDPDDWLVPQACEKAYNQVVANDDDFTYFNVVIYNEDTKKEQVDKFRMSRFGRFSAGQSFSLSELEVPFITTSEAWWKIYKKQFLVENNVRFSTEMLCEDIPFYIKAVLTAKTVSVLNEPLYYHLMRSDSLINCPKNWRDLFSAYKKAYDIIRQSDKCDVFMDSFIPYYVRGVLFWYNRFTKMSAKIKKEFYLRMREAFILLDKENDIRKIRDFIAYDDFRKTIKNGWPKMRMKAFLSRLCSVEEKHNRKVVKILFIKLKFRKK